MNQMMISIIPYLIYNSYRFDSAIELESILTWNFFALLVPRIIFESVERVI